MRIILSERANDMSRQHTGFIALGIRGTSMTTLAQRDTGFFARPRSAPPQNISTTVRGAPIARQADARLFMQPDTPDFGPRRFHEAGAALTQHPPFQIGRQSSA